MSVNVKIALEDLNKKKDTYLSALELKKKFEDYFNNNISAHGEVLICNDFQCLKTNGDVRDLDLIVIGKFYNTSFKINKLYCEKAYNVITKNSEAIGRVVGITINNFCIVIEEKKHRSDKIEVIGNEIYVSYNNELSKHSVTNQSEKQKYSFKDELEAHNINPTPFITNLIWLKNVSKDLLEKLHINNTNVIGSDYTINDIFTIIINSKMSFTKDGEFWYNSVLNKNVVFDIYDKMFKWMEEVKNQPGITTRKKMEAISKEILGDQQYVNEIGKKMIIFSGEPGTGKTIKLIRIAIDLASKGDKRCLVLTYNLSLVSDLRRVLGLIGIPDYYNDGKTIHLSTLHKFFYDLCKDLGIYNDVLDNFIDNYENYIGELLEYSNNGLVSENELIKIKNMNLNSYAYEYVLIDEAQDRLDIEKELVFKIFGIENIIIADGYNQLMRSARKCERSQGLNKNQYLKKMPPERTCIRLKNNLVDLVNEVINLSDGLINSILNKKDLNTNDGGRVILLKSECNYDFIEKIVKESRNKDDSFQNYDLLWLVPDSKRQILECNEGSNNKDVTL